jgi:chromosome segregation ATPase
VLEQRAAAHKAELSQERAATRRAESALSGERAQVAKLKEQLNKWEGVAKVGGAVMAGSDEN